MAPATSWLRTPRARHLGWLAVFLLPLAVGPWLSVTADTVRLGAVAAPPCLLARLLPGVGCPGCGLTRSMALTLQGQFTTAAGVHPLGLPLVLAAALGAVLQLRALWRGGHGAAMAPVARIARVFLAAGLLTVWLLRLLTLAPT